MHSRNVFVIMKTEDNQTPRSTQRIEGGCTDEKTAFLYSAGGMTPLLDRDGKPVVSPILNGEIRKRGE